MRSHRFRRDWRARPDRCLHGALTAAMPVGLPGPFKIGGVRRLGINRCIVLVHDQQFEERDEVEIGKASLGVVA